MAKHKVYIMALHFFYYVLVLVIAILSCLDIGIGYCNTIYKYF